MRWLIPLLLCAGCTDLFVLPLHDDGPGGGGDDAAVDGDGFTGGDAGEDGGPSTLPASCADLPCTPAMNEGDVTFTDGKVSGCHAYRTLFIGSVQTVQATRDPSGIGFAACADTIIVAGVLTATGQGDDSGSGPGAGKSCGSGGTHGGTGADPGGCGTGAQYGDPALPRTFGSGGGSLPAGSGGSGGGVIELRAKQIQVLGFILADGSPGSAGASSGGGSGGSILLVADNIDGAGQITARGGLGIGLAGGGGGGGRVAVQASTANASLKLDVSGGSTMQGGSAGADGTKTKTP